VDGLEVDGSIDRSDVGSFDGDWDDGLAVVVGVGL